MQDTKNYQRIYNHLDVIIANQSSKIKDWILSNYKGGQKPFYGSVDIRNAGFKIAPVDTNLFPAGFNNLNKKAIERAQVLVADYLKRNEIKRILIIPENFTRNQNYFENLLYLRKILEYNNLEIKFGSPYISEVQEHNASEQITIYPFSSAKDEVYLDNNWKPDLIILNNDLTGGIPKILENIAQPIIPELSKGWHKRRKFNHFTSYNEVIQKFCFEFKLDPWLLSTYIAKCENVDFRNKIGLDEAAAAVDDIIAKIKNKYKEYGITSAPYVFIKADNGTFGMGIMVANNGDEILNINKKKRHSMDIIKEGVQNREIIIQEGVPTIHNAGPAPYENIAYLINGEVISFIERRNPSRDHLSNLNSPNAVFSCNSDFTYNTEALVAELALLASIHERY